METVWGLADLFNILMALPNLLSLFLLQREVKEGILEENLIKKKNCILKSGKV